MKSFDGIIPPQRYRAPRHPVIRALIFAGQLTWALIIIDVLVLAWTILAVTAGDPNVQHVGWVDYQLRFIFGI